MILKVKGMKDLYGEDSQIYNHIIKVAHKIATNFSFQTIELPILEYSELFQKGVGQNTDIVSKEMFSFQDQGGRELCLRPEGTAQVVRFVLENGLLRDNFKRYIYTGAMFRAEKPQKGRQRQFHQIGIEIIDQKEYLADVDIVHYVCLLLENLNIKEYTLKINSVGCQKCRPTYNENLKKYLDLQKDFLCHNCNIRKNTNPLRVLDCKNTECQNMYKKAPLLKDFLCQECYEHFEGFKTSLQTLNIVFQEDSFLVRGLDYYSKTAFEVLLPKYLGAQDALCGGGRYDNLFEFLGAKKTVPSVGMALGIERLMIALKNNPDFQLNNIEKNQYYFIVEKELFINKMLPVVAFLRQNNCEVLLDFSSKSISKKMGQSQKLGFNYSVIFGEKEEEENSIQLKNMHSGEQKTIKLNSFKTILQ